MSDPAFTCHFLDREQHRAVEAARMALAMEREKDQAWLAANSASYGWARLDEVVAPCAMWHVRWIFDPEINGDRRARVLAQIAAGTFSNGYLSKFYWQEWSDKRPPICVLCPNGVEWIVDAKSSNGEGWQVTGDVPRITCVPSIDVRGYHGFLRDGIFTASL